MSNITNKSLLLCMIGISEQSITGEFGGITRLQKLMFLLEKEHRIKASTNNFEFIPYKAGPYSPGLYDSLESLENFGYLESKIVSEATEEEVIEINAFNFEDLIEIEGPKPDSYLDRIFRLTKKGKKKVEELTQDPNYTPAIDGIKKIKSKYGQYSLYDLLFYVYSKYPKMITASEIKNKILGIGHKI